MGKLSIGCVLGTVFALAGCATANDGAAPADQVAAASTASADEAPLTGSRLKRKSTDRLLKSVGAQDARNAMDSAPDPLKSGQ